MNRKAVSPRSSLLMQSSPPQTAAICLAATAMLLTVVSAAEPSVSVPRPAFRNSSTPAGNSVLVKASADGSQVLFTSEFLGAAAAQTTGQQLFMATIDDRGIVAPINIFSVSGSIRDIATSDDPDDLGMLIHLVDEKEDVHAHRLIFSDVTTGAFEDYFWRVLGLQPNGPVAKPAVSPHGEIVAFWSTATNIPTGSETPRGGYNLFVIDKTKRWVGIITNPQQGDGAGEITVERPAFTSVSPLGLSFKHSKATSFVTPDFILGSTADFLVYRSEVSPHLSLLNLTPIFEGESNPPQSAGVDDFVILNEDKHLFAIPRPDFEGVTTVLYDATPGAHRILQTLDTPPDSQVGFNSSADGSLVLAGTSLLRLNGARSGFTVLGETSFTGIVTPSGDAVIGMEEIRSVVDGNEQYEVVIRVHEVATSVETELARYPDTRSNSGPSTLIDPSFSANGRYLFFHTEARIVTNDNNNEIDLFRFDLESAELVLVSTNPSSARLPYFGVRLEDGTNGNIVYTDLADGPLGPLPESAIEQDGDQLIDTSARNHRRRFYSTE